MTTKTRQRKMSNPNDPTTWATDPTTWARPTGRRMGGGERVSSANGMTFNASTAGGASRPAETAGGDTVTTPASNGPSVNGAPNVSSDTVATRLVVAEVSRACEHCGAEFVAHRPWARFCGAYCRRRAWLDRNPERAAELHERDMARLREHVIGLGREWVD